MWICAPLAVIAILLMVPSAAFGGGDEQQAPPSAGPRGPWDGPSGKKVPYRPSGTHRCRIDKVRDAGPGSVLGLYVERARCRDATRLVRAYQSCLDDGSGRARGCYDRVLRRCVQPVFLGRCRTYDRFFRRTIKGYRCTERRLYPIRGDYDANVVCVKGERRIDHSYTLFPGRRVAVGTESELRAAWANPRFSRIDVTRDIVLYACRLGDPIRESSRAITVDGGDHVLRQACFEKRLLRQDGTGFVDLKSIELTGGGSDGPGAAVTTRGEIRVTDANVHANLSEEPGGGIMSQRRATIIHSVITGNLANDDGGGVYARRGGIQVYDSVVSNNLVDGSGGALGSTGNILVVRSHIDGNTTDGDGGAIYADEDGDVTVVDSTVNGSTADGPGGAIFTLDGDVTVINSTLIGNRADDRGGAISGEENVAVINSTIARNAAVAHVGGGIWTRGDLYVANSTISNNYAEAQGGGLVAAGTVGLVNSTVIDNTAPVGANIGAGLVLKAFGSIIGPAKTDFSGAQVPPTETNCQVPRAQSFGRNFVTDGSCGLGHPSDRIGALPQLGLLASNGGIGETRLPVAGSPVIDGIPTGECGFAPLGPANEGEQHLEGLIDDQAALMTRDQRGVSRPQGAGCDIGSVEVAQ